MARGWRRLAAATPGSVEPFSAVTEKTDTTWHLPPLPAETPVELSIVFGTYNRLRHLKQCIEACRGVQLAYEFVICDGGSTDGSREWLAAQKDIVLLGDRSLDGAVAAYNRAFALSRGAAIALMNDDCNPQPRAFADAVQVLLERPTVGQVVLPYRQRKGLLAPRRRGHALASYCVLRRETAEAVAAVSGGVWNPIYHTYAADWELSCMVAHLGWEIAELPELGVIDLGDETGRDELRSRNGPQRRTDADRFYVRWPETGEPVLEEDEARRVLVHRRQP